MNSAIICLSDQFAFLYGPRLPGLASASSTNLAISSISKCGQ
jgi:hypothetical protein